jgi:branched-subunit amino acid transport protein AzlD
MKYGQKLKIWDAHFTLRNIEEVQASKLGDASRHPFFIGKNQVTFQDTIFLLLRILCVFLGASLLSLSVCFVLVAAINGWTPTNFFWRRCALLFIAKNTLVFTLIVQQVFSFSGTAFSFIFCLDFCSDLVISLYQGVFRPLVYVGFHLKELLQKRLIDVGKEKKVSCL